MRPGLIDAIVSLDPAAQVTVRGCAVEWHGPETVTLEAAEAELARLDALHLCHAARLADYPPVADYVDAVVRGDDAALSRYIEACRAVKARHPKPEGIR